MSAQPSGPYVEEGVDGLRLLTPILEKRRSIVVGVIFLSLAVGAFAAVMPRKYKAELSLTPVVNNKSATALGGFAALLACSPDKNPHSLTGAFGT